MGESQELEMEMIMNEVNVGGGGGGDGDGDGGGGDGDVRPPKIHGADDDEGAQEHEELIVELRVRAVVCVLVRVCLR